MAEGKGNNGLIMSAKKESANKEMIHTILGRLQEIIHNSEEKKVHKKKRIFREEILKKTEELS
jgi:hypothetical protein